MGQAIPDHLGEGCAPQRALPTRVAGRLLLPKHPRAATQNARRARPQSVGQLAFETSKASAAVVLGVKHKPLECSKGNVAFPWLEVRVPVAPMVASQSRCCEGAHSTIRVQSTVSPPLGNQK